MSFSNCAFNPSIDYFAVLGVQPHACPKTVKIAFRRMARRYHPDVSTIHDAKKKFQEVSEAYEVLSKHREAYLREFKLRNRHSSAFGRRSGTSDWSENRSDEHGHAPKDGSKSSGQKAYSAYRSRRPIHGKDRHITYPLTLRYAMRLLKLGNFYIPGLKVKMKFTQQALEGKTFRLAGKGYKGLYGGNPGDFFVRFEIKNEKIRWEFKGLDIYATFQVTSNLLSAGNEIKLDSPNGPCSVEVPADYSSDDFICIKNMGLPACEEGRCGHLYARLIAA